MSLKGMRLLLHLPCWLGACELAGEWNEWQCPLRSAQGRILIKCYLLPSLMNTASPEWWWEEYLAAWPQLFNTKLQGRDGDNVTSWDQATCFSCMKEVPINLGKFISAPITLVRLCCKACFPLGASKWVAVRCPPPRRDVWNKKKDFRKEQQECIRNACCWAAHCRHRGQHTSQYSEVSVFDTSTGECKQNVGQLVSSLSHTPKGICYMHLSCR